jgi:nucleotide-binding universal stress UspA family protein
LVFSYNKILVPYDGSKPSENAFQQAIQIVNDLLKCESETTNSKQDIQIILLHVIEEIHIRIPSLYFSMRLIAGKPVKEFFKEVYEEMRKEASKMLDDTKKRIKSSVEINSDKSGTKPSSLSFTVIPEVIIGNPAEVIIDTANNKQKVGTPWRKHWFERNFRGKSFRKCFSYSM